MGDYLLNFEQSALYKNELYMDLVMRVFEPNFYQLLIPFSIYDTIDSSFQFYNAYN